MATPHFKLKNKHSENETAILLHVFHKNFPNGRKFVYGISSSILPALWDETAQRAITDKKTLKTFEKSFPTISNDLSNLNRRIDDFELEVKNYFSLTEISKVKVTAEDLKAHLDGKFNQRHKVEVVVRKETLNEYIKRYISELESGKRLYEGKKLKVGSIKNYKTFQTQFDLFQSKKKQEINFDDINAKFHSEFVHFLNSKKIPYRINTVGKHIARIKRLMRASMDEGLHSNDAFSKENFPAYQVETDEVYLTEDELIKLENLDLSDHPEWILYRDIFLIGCYTAQRVSDYNEISAFHIGKLDNGKPSLTIYHQRKGSQKVIIPMKTALKRLLQKYNYSPPRIVEQTLNDNIKDICELAKINDMIEIEEVIGGSRVRDLKPKHAMVSSHTARRTGATNMYLGGVRPIDIMTLTGHKKESTFLKYIRIGKEETANRLSEHAYFN